MKITVGKTYLTRDGQVVEITDKIPGISYPFRGFIKSNREGMYADTWTEDGYYFGTGSISQFDLVKETKMIKIQIGDHSFSVNSKEEAIAVLEGTHRPNGYYISSTKGLIKIADMDENHIRNALTKKMITYFEGLKTEHRVSEYLEKFIAGIKDPLVRDLFQELEKRSEKYFV